MVCAWDSLEDLTELRPQWFSSEDAARGAVTAVQTGLPWQHFVSTRFSGEDDKFSCFEPYHQLECLTFHNIW